MKNVSRHRRKQNTDYRKVIFSAAFLLTILLSFAMVVMTAVNGKPTLLTTLVSGGGWLVFSTVFGIAIRQRWSFLWEECSTGRMSGNQSRQSNWEGNCFKFGISITVLLVHVLVLLFGI